MRATSIKALDERVMDQSRRIADRPELFAYDRNGLRMAIASIEDESNELYTVWVDNHHDLSGCVAEVRHELLDIAAVAMLAYERTFDK